jgi:hypothetical protein
MSSRETYLKDYIRAYYRDRQQESEHRSNLDPKEVEQSQKALFGDWSWVRITLG